ncbi:MAG: hypothetical protein E7384_04040 [Ruminococcaceae bacterium]|nr:hypothetical protein [Oscillospiraceae bacterium]
MIYKSFYFYSIETFKSMCVSKNNTFLEEAMRIYLPYNAFTTSDITRLIADMPCEKVAVLPYINKGNARTDFANKFDAVCETADGFLIENIGDLPFLDGILTATGTPGGKAAGNKSDKFLCGDYSLNVFNAESAAFWAASGLNSITFSPEPEAAEQIRLANAVCKLPDGTILPEIIVGGKVIVMRSEHCFITDDPKYHCGKCGKNGTAGYTITDNAGNEFPLIGLPLDCQNLVLSAKNIEIDEEYVKKHISGDCILRYNILNDYR